jgi:hypothetical protein
MKNSDLNDRGVSQDHRRRRAHAGHALPRVGVLGRRLATPSAIAAATYGVELEWDIPVAEDETNLLGAIFLQTSTADLTLTLDLLPLASAVHPGHRHGGPVRHLPGHHHEVLGAHRQRQHHRPGPEHASTR